MEYTEVHWSVLNQENYSDLADKKCFWPRIKNIGRKRTCGKCISRDDKIPCN
jgi:hypothetical protein